MELKLSWVFSSLSKALCESFGKCEPRFDRVIVVGNAPSNGRLWCRRTNYFVAAMVFMDLCSNQCGAVRGRVLRARKNKNGARKGAVSAFDEEVV